MASVRVAVRVRPINKREVNLGSTCIISVEGNKTSITNLKIPAGVSPGRDIGRERVKSFTYDYSYWSVNPNDAHFASQEMVHSNLGTDVLKAAFEGYNACIFAYGQTGSGKSYTMMGEEHCPGLIPRICEGLYQRIKSEEDEAVSYRTEVSYLEIYCERVRDLLRDSKEHNLKVREHPRDGPYVQNLSTHLVSDYHDIKVLMDQGNVQRTTASTNMNDVSSRSHAIFTIKFTQAKFNADMPSETVSKINLVDLAGSERANSTGATGERLKEGANINKSLVTLGNVISALADISLASTNPRPARGKRKSLFIPYRDSVLTWLLKDSLGGNSKTIMVATISPADVNYGETLSTLRYANRAKDIINKPTINEDPNIKLIRELRAEISRLKARLGDMGDEVKETETAVVDKLHENEARVKILTEEWATKWRDAQKLMQDKNLALRSDGNIIMVDIELPHLIAIDDDILSTGLKIYHIHDGKTSIGNIDAAEKPDIALSGHDVEEGHCYLTSVEGKVWLDPCGDALCAVNGKVIDGSTRLTQGCLVSIGKTNLFRFNHPADAQRMRLEMKSSSTSDLSTMKATENLLASTFFQTYGMEKDEDKDSLEQLVDKSICFSIGRDVHHMIQRKQLEFEELTKQFTETDKERKAEIEKKSSEVSSLKQELEKLREEQSAAERRVQEASRAASEEQKRLARRSLSLMQQVEEFEQEKKSRQREIEGKITELEAEKRRLVAERDDALNELERERATLKQRQTEKEAKIAALSSEKERELSEIQRDLIEQRKALEEKIGQQKQEQCQKAGELDEKAMQLDEALRKSQEDFEAKRRELQRERDEERHFLDMEREKVEAHRAKHQLAINLAEKMEETTRKQLTRESSEISKARGEFERRKQRQLEAMEEAEKSIESKAETLVNEIWESRAQLEEDKKVLEEQRDAKKAMLLDSREQLTPTARELLEKQLGEIELDIRHIVEAQAMLDVEEENVEKVIEEEFVRLDGRKQTDQKQLEDDWRALLDIEAANLWFIEQEVTERNDALEEQRLNLDGKEATLREFQAEQAKTLDDLSREKENFVLERERVLAEFQKEVEGSEQALGEVEGQLEAGRREYLETSPVESKLRGLSEEHKGVVREEESCGRRGEEIRTISHQRLETIEEESREQVAQLEELKQAEDFVDSKQQQERKKLNATLAKIHELEEQVHKAQEDLSAEKKRFESEQRRESAKLEAEKKKMKEMEKQERMQQLIEEQVQLRLTKEYEERKSERQKEQKERELMLEQMRKEHQEELKELKDQLRRNSFRGRSSPENTNGESTDPARRILQLIDRPLTPHTGNLRDAIKVTIPKFLLRGHGWDSYYVFEVHVSVLEESWVVYRRYSKFRELHDYMRQKYHQVNALQFPPKRLFGNRSEKVIQKRRYDLENYLQNFILICQKIPHCPIAPGPGRVLSKQELCDFSYFFRKGAFEETKYVSG